MSNNSWFPNLRRRPGARLQLFCFPFAGGGASAYFGWTQHLPPWIEVWPLEYPGHETRLREQPVNDALSLASLISVELATAIELPFAFFGHSMGALLAFESARALRRRHGPQPLALFVSGHGDPQLPPFRRPIARLPEPAFREELRSYGGTPDAVLADEELMGFLSPLLRLDLGLCETYVHGAEPRLDFPITAFGGTADPTVPWHRLFEWGRESSVDFRAHVLPGNHFFLRDAAPQVCRIISDQLARGADSGALAPPGAAEVHLWRIETPDSDAALAPWRSVLSPEELVRADAFVQPTDRGRFVMTRAALRMLLGQYASVAAASVTFSYSAYGKPLCPTLAPLQFNVAHSGSVALIAVANDQSIGVDIERIRAGIEPLQIGRNVFTPAELHELSQRTPASQPQAFFELWTRKEAYLKCSGEGFSGVPERAHVGLSTSELLVPETRGASGHAAAQRLMSFDLAPLYAAALAAEKGCSQVTFRNWQQNVVS